MFYAPQASSTMEISPIEREAVSLRALGISSDDTDIPVVAKALVNALLAAAAELGVDCNEALAYLGVAQTGDLASHRFEALLQWIAKRSMDPAAGAHVGALIRPEHLNIVGAVMVSALTAQDAVQRFLLMRKTVLGGPAWRVLAQDSLVLIGVGTCSPLVAQLCAAIACNVALSILGGSGKDELRVCLKERAPAHAARVATAFPVPVVFGAALNGVTIPKHYYERSSEFSDPLLADGVLSVAASLESSAPPPASWSRRVWHVLHASPHAANVELEAIAPLWNVSARTLRRWLEAEGTSFRALRYEVVMQVAQELLARELTVACVAQRVGFASESAFRRAYKRKLGVGPTARATAR